MNPEYMENIDFYFDDLSADQIAQFYGYPDAVHFELAGDFYKRRAKERARQRKAAAHVPAHVPAHIAAPKSGRGNIGGGYWKQVWKILGITMFWGVILAIVLAAIVCSIDFISRLFL